MTILSRNCGYVPWLTPVKFQHGIGFSTTGIPFLPVMVAGLESPESPIQIHFSNGGQKAVEVSAINRTGVLLVEAVLCIVNIVSGGRKSCVSPELHSPLAASPVRWKLLPLFGEIKRIPMCLKHETPPCCLDSNRMAYSSGS